MKTLTLFLLLLFSTTAFAQSYSNLSATGPATPFGCADTNVPTYSGGNLICGAGGGGGGGSVWGSITGTLSSQTDLQTALNAKQNSLGFTAENVANKSIDGTFTANSDTLYPSQKAAKTYVDTGLATKQATLTPGNASTSTTGITVVGTAATVGPAITVDVQTATNAQPGLLSAADHTSFAAKQSALPVGTTLQYLRGDLIDATLDTSVVPENGNLYFTTARARASVSAVAPLVDTAGAFSIPLATGSADGYLSSTDWTTFNGKQPAGNYITATTGDVVATGPGSVAATIQSNVVSNAKLAQAPTLTLKGNNTGGTANETDLTVNQVNTMLGTVTAVTGTAPIVSSGGATPAISIPAATSLVNGYLTSTDWTTFNNKFSLPAFTAGSVPFSSGGTLGEDNTNFFFDSANHSLSVGPGPHPATSADLAISSQAGDTKVGLSVFSTSTNNAVQISNQNGFSLAAFTASATNSPSINFERSRGTLTAKTQALAGDILGSFVFNGYTGAVDGPFAAGFGAIATQNQTVGAAGAQMIFETTPNGSSTLTPRLVIDQNGNTQPFTDNVYTLGTASLRWSEVYLPSGGAQSQLNGKQATLPVGTSAQYLRADLTDQTLDTLAVPENTNLYFTNARAQGAVSATAPIIDTAGVFSMHVADATHDGYLSAVDWSNFNSAAGGGITSLTGEATGSGPGAATVTLSNAAVIGKALTGFSAGAGTVAATDSILQGFNKVVGNIATKQGALNVVTKTTTYTAVNNDVVRCDATGGAFTTTLPAAAPNPNAIIRIKKIDVSANNCDLAPTGADTLEYKSSQALTAQGQAINLISNGVDGWESF